MKKKLYNNCNINVIRYELICKKYSLGADGLLPCEQQEYSFVGLPVNLLWLKNGKLSLISAESRVYTVTVYTEAFTISTNPSPLSYKKFEVWTKLTNVAFEFSCQTFCKILPYVSMLQCSEWMLLISDLLCQSHEFSPKIAGLCFTSMVYRSKTTKNPKKNMSSKKVMLARVWRRA